MTHLLKPRLSTSAVALTALALLAFALTSAAGAARSAKTNAIVASASSGLGRILIDRHGRTLYLFDKDTQGMSACAGPCASYWPPLLTSGKPLAVLPTDVVNAADRRSSCE